MHIKGLVSEDSSSQFSRLRPVGSGTLLCTDLVELNRGPNRQEVQLSGFVNTNTGTRPGRYSIAQVPRWTSKPGCM